MRFTPAVRCLLVVNGDIGHHAAGYERALDERRTRSRAARTSARGAGSIQSVEGWASFRVSRASMASISFWRSAIHSGAPAGSMISNGGCRSRPHQGAPCRVVDMRPLFGSRSLVPAR